MADSILRLKVESQEYDAKIKRAAEGIQRFAEQVYKSGGAVTELEKDQVAFIKSLGNMETVSNTTTGKLREMETAYKNLSATYHLLQRDQQNDAGGKALRASLDQLKTRIDETRTAIKKADSELNDFSQTEKNFSKESFNMNGILSQIGGQMGINTSLMSGLTTGTMGMTAAIGAAVAVEVKAAQAFKEYNDQLAKQQHMTSVTLGIKGPDANDVTVAARSISKVYGTDFREVINAANTIMTQFGTDSEFAINLIRKGMQGMIQGDGPKLLSMIQQYAPAFRDAGISASQLVAIIQNSEGGIFTDDNMNAIVMGIKNIRLMSKATSDALAQIGINGEKMTKQLNDGTMTIFQALRKVSEALSDTEAGSQQAGTVMQQVFGRQGTAAGSNLAKAIENLNTNLDETVRQTGEVGKALSDLERETEKLEKSMMQLLAVDNWDVMINKIESGVVGAFNNVLEIVNSIFDIIDNIGNAIGGPVTQYLVDLVVALHDPVMLLRELNKYMGGGGNSPQPDQTDAIKKRAQNLASGMIGNVNKSDNKSATYSRYFALLEKTIETARTKGDEEGLKIAERARTLLEESMDNTFRKFGGVGKRITETPKPSSKTTKSAIDYDPDSIMAQKKLVQELTQKWEAAGDAVRDEYKKQLEEAQYTLDILTGREKFNAGKMSQIVPLSVVPQIDITKPLDIRPLKEQIQLDINAENIKVDQETLKTILRDAIQNGINNMDLQFTMLNKQIQDGINVNDETWQKILDDYNKLREQIGQAPIQIDFKTGRQSSNREDTQKETDSIEDVSKLVGSLNSIVGGLQQMGVKLPESATKVITAIQGLVSVIQGVNAIVGLVNTSTVPAKIASETANTSIVSANTGAMIALTAAVTANTAALGVNSATEAIPLLANGGIVPHAADGYFVPGNKRSSDLTPIMANAGELVLNKSAQANLAASLEGSNGGGEMTPSFITGEQIFVAANRYTKRTGQGEIVTWKK